MVCAECMKMCCLGGKNSVVKGLTIDNRDVTGYVSIIYGLTQPVKPQTKLFYRIMTQSFVSSLVPRLFEWSGNKTTQ